MTIFPSVFAIEIGITPSGMENHSLLHTVATTSMALSLKFRIRDVRRRHRTHRIVVPDKMLVKRIIRHRRDERNMIVTKRIVMSIATEKMIKVKKMKKKMASLLTKRKEFRDSNNSNIRGCKLG
jgi:hypothetical protein